MANKQKGKGRLQVGGFSSPTLVADTPLIESYQEGLQEPGEDCV